MVGTRSKFQHLYADLPKKDKQWNDPPLIYSSGESSYAAASSKFVAFPRQGPGGPVVVLSLDKAHRLKGNAEIGLNSLKAKVTGLQWNPFNPNILALGAENGDIHIHKIEDPESWETAQREPLRQLSHHSKKVYHVEFNPTVNGLLASSCFDQTSAYWDWETGEVVREYNDCKAKIADLKWNYDGSLACYALKASSKQMVVVDPRAPEAAVLFDSFDTAKTSKVFFVPDYGYIGSVGFGKKRKQVKLWDLRNTEKPLETLHKDSNGSVLMPHMDYDHNVLYLFGKGENSVEWLQITNEAKKIKSISCHRDNIPQKGGCFVPKTGLDVMKSEVGRFIKVTQKAIIPISLVIPRRDKTFQEEIFPPTRGWKPVSDMDKWGSGENAEVVRMDLNPATRDNSQAAAMKKSYSELADENEALKARVADLEKQLGVNQDEHKEEA